MKGWLGLLLVPAIVAALTAAVPSLRDQARLQMAMLPRSGADARHRPKNDPILGWLDSSAPRALDVAASRPDSPDLLLAAALISSDGERARSTLENLAHSDGRPLIWAVYVDYLLAIESGRLRLSRGEADDTLSALRGWQKADPENALPVALEAWALWDRGSGGGALERWTAAGERPKLTPYITDRVQAIADLLGTMGTPAPEALTGARLVASFAPWSDPLCLAASTASITARSAASDGNAPAALDCWQSTIDLGLRAEETGDSVAAYRTGAILRAGGASPFWTWVPDSAGGRGRSGPVGGRFYYGPQHDLYVKAHGQESARQLVRQLAADAARMHMLEAVSGQADPEGPSSRAADALLFGLLAGLVALGSVLLLPFALILPDQESDARPVGVSPVVYLALAVAALLATAIAAGLLVALAGTFPVTPLYAPSPQQLVPAVVVPLLGLAIAALLVAVHQAHRRRTLAYRGVFARSLLAAAALMSVFYLATGLLAARARADWLRQWRQPGLTELQLATRPLGARWRTPPMLPGAWEEAPPPEVPPASRH